MVDASELDEVADVEEFAGYGPILGCAIVPLLAIATVAAWALAAFNGPVWLTGALATVYVTFPIAAFTRWVWTKPAIRLSSGVVLPRRVAVRYAVTLWAVTVSILVWRMLSW